LVIVLLAITRVASLIHSCDVKEATKEPYGDGKHATIALHAMPYKWQMQYDLGHKALPNIKYLQDALEKIEAAFLLGNRNGSSKNNGKGNKMTKMSDTIFPRRNLTLQSMRGLLRSLVPCARSMGAQIRLTTRVIARSTITKAI
jgi:hypothetical protein